MIFDRFDVAVLPFPVGAAADQATRRRPALALSTRGFALSHGHTLFAMITAGAGVPWASDVPIVDLAAAGLPAASLVRLKLFTVDNAVPVGRLGSLAKRDAKAVRRALAAALGEDD